MSMHEAELGFETNCMYLQRRESECIAQANKADNASQKVFWSRAAEGFRNRRENAPVLWLGQIHEEAIECRR